MTTIDTTHLFRTFPHHDYFTDGQGIGQENLFNVLKAYSLYSNPCFFFTPRVNPFCSLDTIRRLDTAKGFLS